MQIEQEKQLDHAVSELSAKKADWAKKSIEDKIALLEQIKVDVYKVADLWVNDAIRHKRLPHQSSLAGEEWLSGPYALINASNVLIRTLSAMKDKQYLNDLTDRKTVNGQLAVSVFPNTMWDRWLLSGVSAEVWMDKVVTKDNLRQYSAVHHDIPLDDRQGSVSLILGAGNIASISPLDCFQKLFTENSVVILKMNPVNDYLATHIETSLKSVIDVGAMKVVKGGSDVGAYLCQHEQVDEIHITGAKSSHDAIVWGVDNAEQNKKNGTPVIDKKITSELGAVCPTIVVPGEWSKADINFQAQHLATQKLHNSAFNCIAMQCMIVSENWQQTDGLIHELKQVIADSPDRPPYYPGAEQRMSEFVKSVENSETVSRAGGSECVIAEVAAQYNGHVFNDEVFAPALAITKLEAKESLAFLNDAIDFANDKLEGTLGVNILIHPNTLKQIGNDEFERAISRLEYGAVAINAWTGVNFVLPQCPWGAFPHHTLEDVGSGIGLVHNAFMFEKVEKSVVTAPFKPFPRSLFSAKPSLLPKPPWFITNKQSRRMGKLLTDFQYKPSWMKVLRLFLIALRG